MTVQLPVDVMSLPPFRVLEGELGTARALWLWWIVWRELAYLSQEGLSAGRVRGEDRDGLVRAMETVGKVEGGKQKAEMGAEDGSGEGLWELVVRSRLMKADGEDWVCARFANLHGASCLPRTMAQRGGDMRAFALRQGKAGEQAFQQALLIGEEKMVDATGEPLAPELRQRVTRLVVSCDNALYHNQRPTHGYTEGLVQDALGVLGRFSDEEIDQVCRFVASRRNHPLLTTAEKLLPRFGEMVRLLEGQ